MNLTFLGATQTVTGSKYLVQHEGRKILIDCGLFQGVKNLRLKNREPLPFDPAELDAVLLTHAHIDHSGYLPLLVKNGFDGPIYATSATIELCSILLPDSGRLQEEEADFANRHHYSRHDPAAPLYTEEDARRVLPQFRHVRFDEHTDVVGVLGARWLPAGHILGAAMIRVTNGEANILFSGDLGRLNDPVMYPPVNVHEADYLVLESTYGNRRHPDEDPAIELADVIRRTVDRNGVVIVPSFAVGRAQSLLYLINRLQREGAIPRVPVYLDSPMAIDATAIFYEHIGEHRLSTSQCQAIYDGVRLVRTVDESKAIGRMRSPMIIVSASGMATGGRVLHHIKEFAPGPHNTILFAGYQAAGTRGADMVEGRRAVKIHGEYVTVRAEVASLDNMSGHADYEEILTWLSTFDRPPLRTWLTHGEPAAADAMRRHVEERYGWDCRVPEYGEKTTLRPRPRRVGADAGGAETGE